MMYKLLLRPLLFLLDPERAHRLAMALLKGLSGLPLSWLRRLLGCRVSSFSFPLMGLTFPSRVGLAAGLDKNAEAVDAWAAMGFGFVEIGTVTPQPQPGNPKPRLFRLKGDRALINRMGFNNDGAEAISKRLARRKSDIIVGGNIGKNKTTPNEEAVNDYLTCFDTLFDVVDYFVVNVSSPNTPGLRALQEKSFLAALLRALMIENKKKVNPKPILLKIAPDLSEAELTDVVEVVKETKISGVIATNTTIGRTGLSADASRVQAMGAGGLSGSPIASSSNQVIRFLHQKAQGAFPIIGVGGIDSAAAAQEKIDAGADMVQLYSGLVYEGTALLRAVRRQIDR